METTSPVKYGITEKKKADLDALAIKIIDADAVVQQQSAIVDSLVLKLNMFNNYLSVAEINREKALDNKNTVDAIVQDAYELNASSSHALNTIFKGEDELKNVAKEVTSMVNKLIFSAETIDKLSSDIVKAKYQNELISDDLISKISSLNTDANNAVALALVALKSVFNVHGVGLEAKSAIELESFQADTLYTSLTEANAIQDLLHQAYHQAKQVYKKAYEACNATKRQLNAANANLTKAQIKLTSLESGLAAATAAAYA